MAPEARNKFGVFETEVFWKQMYCIEKSSLLVTLLGLFSALHSHSVPQ